MFLGRFGNSVDLLFHHQGRYQRRSNYKFYRYRCQTHSNHTCYHCRNRIDESRNISCCRLATYLSFDRSKSQCRSSNRRCYGYYFVVLRGSGIGVSPFGKSCRSKNGSAGNAHFRIISARHLCYTHSHIHVRHSGKRAPCLSYANGVASRKNADRANRRGHR